MKKIINGSRIEFWNEETNEMIMYIDYPCDECIWYFNNSEAITITKDMKLFELLKNIMSQQYKFSNDEVLKSYKNNNSFKKSNNSYIK